jgi:hypothetical protein
MTFRPTHWCRLAMVIALSAGSFVAGVNDVAGARTVPHIIVTPSRGLVSGSIVHIAGSGFEPKERINFSECLRAAIGDSGCAISTHETARTNANGVLPAFNFKVIAGMIGVGKCGTSIVNLRNCSINAANNLGGDATTSPIQFKLSKE